MNKYHEYAVEVAKLEQLKMEYKNLNLTFEEFKAFPNDLEYYIASKFSTVNKYYPVIKLDTELTLNYLKEQKEKIKLEIEKQIDIVNAINKKFGLKELGLSDYVSNNKLEEW